MGSCLAVKLRGPMIHSGLISLRRSRTAFPKGCAISRAHQLQVRVRFPHALPNTHYCPFCYTHCGRYIYRFHNQKNRQLHEHMKVVSLSYRLSEVKGEEAKQEILEGSTPRSSTWLPPDDRITSVSSSHLPESFLFLFFTSTCGCLSHTSN